MFLDTGPPINLISLNFLRKAKPGLVIMEPTAFNIQGATGNKLTPEGVTQINATFGNYYMFTLTGVIVEQKTFPENLLIGYDTMREEDVTFIPAKEGAKITYKFLLFVNTRSQDIMATVSQHRTTEAITAYRYNNVADRYLNNSSPVIHGKHIPTKNPTKPPQTTKQNEHNALAEVLKIVSGSVTESTLLQAQSIC